jgi:RsmE family RNA methyltransferase
MFAGCNTLILDRKLNRVVLNEQDSTLKIKDSLYTLRDPEVLAHLMGHLLIKPEDSLKVIVLGKGLGRARVVKTSPEEVTLDVTIEEKGLTQNIHLLIGASRPPTVKKIIEHGASFGVKSFSFFKAELSEKSYLTSKVFEEASLLDLLTKGLAQGSSYCELPTVKRYQSLSEAIKNTNENRFLLSLKGENTFQNLNIDLKNPLTLAIGPERGWTAQEESFLTQNSFQPVLIGNSTLRVEIATFSALGQLAMLSLNR